MALMISARLKQDNQSWPIRWKLRKCLKLLQTYELDDNGNDKAMLRLSEDKYETLHK